MTRINFRVDDKVKEDAENALKSMGMNMSTALNIYLVKIGKEKRIPFEISAEDPFYSDENIKRLKKSANEMEQTGGTIHKIEDFDDV